MMRQSLALAFVLLALAYLIKEKYVYHYIFIAFACLIHSSAAITVVYLPIFLILRTSSKELSGKRIVDLPLSAIIKWIVLLLLPILFTIYFVQIMQMLAGAGLIAQKYTAYYSMQGQMFVSTLVILIYAIQLLCVACIKNGSRPFFVALMIYAIVLYSLTGISQYLWRVGSYFLYPSVLAISMNDSLSNIDTAKSKVNKAAIARLVFVGVALVFWYLQIVVWGNHQTIPYTSVVLGI